MRCSYGEKVDRLDAFEESTLVEKTEGHKCLFIEQEKDTNAMR